MNNIPTEQLVSKAQRIRSWLLTHRNPLDCLRLALLNPYTYDRDTFNKGFRIYNDLVKELKHRGMTEDDVKHSFPNQPVEQMESYEVLAIMIDNDTAK